MAQAIKADIPKNCLRSKAMPYTHRSTNEDRNGFTDQMACEMPIFSPAFFDTLKPRMMEKKMAAFKLEDRVRH